MKRLAKLFVATAMFAIFATLLTGCNNNKILNKLEKTEYFSASYDKAIKQTQISSIVANHLNNNKDGFAKKALLVTIDGMSAQSLPYFYDFGKGISRVAKDGGLYWTIPDNMETKAKVDIGVNFLQVVTGKEPSSFEVLKSTDAKREVPFSIMTSASKSHAVAFLTDNENYINVQLAQELNASKQEGLKYGVAKDIHELKTNCLAEIEFKRDFIALAISSPYFVADQNFDMSNPNYLAEIINLNVYLDEIYSSIKERENEDWLVVIASTFGGKKTLEKSNTQNNILTFMATSKKMG